MSTETDQIVERLGFFFSDANLRMDRFLRQIVLDYHSGGFVEINTLLKFNTIKKLSTDPAVIAEAVAKVESPKLKLNDEKTSIARVDPFTSEMLKDNVKVSLRVSDLPVKENEDGSGSEYVNSRDEVEKLFSEFGKVALVRLLTYYDKRESKRTAVGKAFVEFASMESMEKAVAELCASGSEEKPKKVLKLGETELRVKTMQQWLDKKAAEKDAKDNERETAKRAREEDSAKAQEEIETIEFKLDWKKGCVVTLEGVPEGCDREMLLDVVKKNIGDVEARADYSRGDTDGKIRFNEPNDKIAELVIKLNDGSVTVGGGEGKLTKAGILEGEAEDKYYENYIAFRTKQMREKAQEKLGRQNKKRRR